MISIICPVFNKQKYLSKTIRTVISQSLEDWELILINDCSTDGSSKIINSWKNRDGRIRVINHKENYGVDQARFTGLENSNGDYIFFLDADDWLPPNSLQILYDNIEETKSDVVYGSFTRVLDKYGIFKKQPQNYYGAIKSGVISNPSLFEDYYISYFGVNKLLVSMCGKLYNKKTILKSDIHPSHKKMGEDLIFNLKLHPHLEKISFVPEVVYFYRFGGMTVTGNPTFLEDIKEQYKFKKNQLEKYNYSKALAYIKHELINCFYSHFLNLRLLSKISKNSLKELITKELNDPVYFEINYDLGNSKKTSAIIEKDYNLILNLIDETYKRTKWKFYFKKIVSKILT